MNPVFWHYTVFGVSPKHDINYMKHAAEIILRDLSAPISDACIIVLAARYVPSNGRYSVAPVTSVKLNIGHVGSSLLRHA